MLEALIKGCILEKYYVMENLITASTYSTNLCMYVGQYAVYIPAYIDNDRNQPHWHSDENSYHCSQNIHWHLGQKEKQGFKTNQTVGPLDVYLTDI